MQTDGQTDGTDRQTDRRIVQWQRQTAVRTVTVMLIAMASGNGRLGECEWNGCLESGAWVCDMSPAFSTKLVPIFPERSVKLSLSECQMHYNNNSSGKSSDSKGLSWVLSRGRSTRNVDCSPMAKRSKREKKTNRELAGKFEKLQAAALCQNDKLQGVNLALISLGNLNLHIFPTGGRTHDIRRTYG